MKNILIFCADQLRADTLSHLGQKFNVTPNFDKLVEEAVSFRSAYCQNPVCSPSRCSFLTGFYPHVLGHRTMHFLMDDDDPNIFKELRKHGYYVKWTGKNDFFPADHDYSDSVDDHFIPNVEGTVFNERFQDIYQKKCEDKTLYDFYWGKMDAEDVKEDLDYQALNNALDFIENYDKDKPFCLFMPMCFPHPEYYVEEPYFSMFRDRMDEIELLPDILDLQNKPGMLKQIRINQNLSESQLSKMKEIKATYYGMTNRLDNMFGQVVNKLKEKNFYDDSLIIVMSDHGDFTGDYNLVEKVQNCYEECIVNVPFIIKPPKSFNIKPRISDELIELLDLPATISDIVGFELSYDQFGKSLVPLFTEEKELHHSVHTEGGRLNHETQAMERGHTPESIYYPRLSAQGLDNIHTKATMLRNKEFKYVKRFYEKDELYDLKKDPKCLNNIIDDEEYKDILYSLQMEMLDWYQETCDYVPRRKDKR